MVMPDLDRILKSLPVHYDACNVLRTAPTAWRPCSCTATADVEALLDHTEQQSAMLDEVDDTLAAISGPDDDGT